MKKNIAIALAKESAQDVKRIMSFKLDRAIILAIEREAARLKVTKSAIVRAALKIVLLNKQQ